MTPHSSLFRITGYLSLSENEFTGTLPSEMTEMTALSLLFLDGNDFGGTIPSGIERLQELGKSPLSPYARFVSFINKQG